ncbi:MAG: hypothetical protein LBS92_06805 [Candidatus Methanoplasma sp.]|jgi:hypothetical protein|nr:hypothetical protein [Candidatus Methanoplasma sp.]
MLAKVTAIEQRRHARPEERVRVLAEVAGADATIVYVCIDKKDPNGPFARGNELYRMVLEGLMRDTMKASPCMDLRIVVDKSWFIDKNRLTEMAENLSKELNRNVKSCNKVSSDRCVRIADYVVGSIWARYERENDEYFDMARGRISVAR